MSIFLLIYRIINKIKRELIIFISNIYCLFLFKIYNVKYCHFEIFGIPIVRVGKKGKLTIGNNFKMNSGENFNQIGRQQKCFIIAKGDLTIKDNVGLSCTAIICLNRIEIGNNVKIGGNTVIYDSDFHSLDGILRKDYSLDKQNVKMKPVVIEDDVFIGAHSTILKGVVIGRNSIIGACSVVAKNIPANQIWAGNPARFIRVNENHE